MRIERLGPADEERVREAASLFDDPVDDAATARFLADERHFLLIGYENDEPAGFLSAVELEHADEPRAEMFLYEVGVEERFRRRGIARALIAEMLSIAKDRGCREMFVLTEEDNDGANGLYASTRAERSKESVVMYTWFIDGRSGR